MNYLTPLLAYPDLAEQLDESQWDLVIRQARAANLLARLGMSLEANRQIQHVPKQAAWHLNAAQVVANRQAIAVHWEVQKMSDALLPLDVPIILLKGAAYVLSRLNNAKGRIFSDIDILVPKSDLNRVEAALMQHGWLTTHHNTYDQRYYRRWMHELPPMRHTLRNSVLDVHHNILPETGRCRPDATKLLSAAIPIPNEPGIWTLCPVDMILHSATHLLHDGELGHGLRDLVDLDSLFRDFATTESFRTKLVERAIELQLTRPLYYALTHITRLFSTPGSAQLCSDLEPYAPKKPIRNLINRLLQHAFNPDHPSTSNLLTPLARKVLYIRAHWLRMPMHLLAYHLTVKALRPKTLE